MTSNGTSTGTPEDQITRAQPSLTDAPGRRSTVKTAQLPENLNYRVKRFLLGPPLVNDQLQGQRLGKPTALAVLSSDVMSSSAYATEEILRILVPSRAGGVLPRHPDHRSDPGRAGRWSPILYRDVVRSYPKAGGSYVVSRDNFGPNVAQVAGAALLISYTITVAVSVAAGADAIISAVPAARSRRRCPLSIAFVVLLAFGNLRGIREAGKVFALPTYFFIAQHGGTDRVRGSSKRSWDRCTMPPRVTRPCHSAMPRAAA